MKTLDAGTYHKRRDALEAEREAAIKAFSGAALDVALGNVDEAVQVEAQAKTARIESQLEALEAAWAESVAVEKIEQAKADRKRWEDELSEIDAVYAKASKQAAEIEDALSILVEAIDNAEGIQNAIREMSTRWRLPRGVDDQKSLLDFHGRANNKIATARAALEQLPHLSTLADEMHGDGVSALSLRAPASTEETN
ncbi:hypothetical protein [Altererythrobacter lutimaris]|uniref:Uncharacterized protein n=1 Tax=Altererythrobacter lutimaris TaxID=2743979 RepID=A0A850HA98_9SPHN|nr:hypothetical protein [Altererythrobacter lutimaris]NVE93378.1 hypothetical protein [Altererythrobacter lutimaris]